MENKAVNRINIKRIFIIFLILHLTVWSTLSLVRQIMPIDAMECIYWGGLADLGTNKHPPLAGRIAYIVYNLFGKQDLSIYVLGQVSIITGFLYLYKLGKLFLSETASILAVMILEACFVFTYMGIYDGFNPNFLLLSFLPIITYYFYKSVNEGNVFDWVKLGVFVGLSFLAKYQTLMLFIPLLLFLLITKTGRKQFKKKGFYISALVAFLIVLPHIIWLYEHNFFSFNYFILCEERYATFYEGPLKYLWSPFIFLFNQFLTIAGVLFIYFTIPLFAKEKFSINNEIKKEDSIFLICAGILPVFFQSLSGLNGNYMIPQWGYSLVFLTGILLFYFFPYKISDKVIKYVICWTYAAMFITFVVLGIVFTTEKNFANRFPVEQITNTLNQIYESETGKPMKYIGGFIELSIPISLYNNGNYVAVLNTYNYPNPWIKEQDIRNSGVIIVGRKQSLFDEYIRTTAPNISQKPKVMPFEFTVKSVIGKVRKYTMYYAIVPSNYE